MSVDENGSEQQGSRGRKRNVETAEIEIDVDAPEPPSKKSLRKAKRAKSTAVDDSKATERVLDTSSAQPKASQDNQTRSPYGIWIGNLSFTTTRDDLVKFLTEQSQGAISNEHITRINLPQNPPKHGKEMNKGFSYVDFSTEESLNAALELSEGLLGGRRVLIKNAKSYEGRPEPKKDQEEAQTKAPSKRIFIGNLEFDTTAEDLEGHFGVCGPIIHTHMATFEDSGKCKGYAWVEFEQLASAQAAMRGWMEANGAHDKRSSDSRPGKHRIWLGKINGRKLRMEYAEDKATRYQKRFGKNAKSSQSAATEDGSLEDPIQEVNGDSEPVHKKREVKKASRKKDLHGKYTEDTVQRLTGAIVESQGQRVVFD
ncbi:Nucleolar protein 13 [Exophiala xenobiotica]|nr:Nucleolar protein 13 [Exophiala xenobiotica]